MSWFWHLLSGAQFYQRLYFVTLSAFSVGKISREPRLPEANCQHFSVVWQSYTMSCLLCLILSWSGGGPLLPVDLIARDCSFVSLKTCRVGSGKLMGGNNCQPEYNAAKPAFPCKHRFHVGTRCGVVYCHCCKLQVYCSLCLHNARAPQVLPTVNCDCFRCHSINSTACWLFMTVYLQVSVWLLMHAPNSDTFCVCCLKGEQVNPQRV